MAKRFVRISLATKFRLLLGAAVIVIISAALLVPWYFTELLGEHVLEERERPRLPVRVGHQFGDQVRLEVNPHPLRRPGGGGLEVRRRERRHAHQSAGHECAEVAMVQRPPEEVGPQRDEDAEPGRPGRLTEVADRRFAPGVAQQLLELVDDEEQAGAVGKQRLDGPQQVEVVAPGRWRIPCLRERRCEGRQERRHGPIPRHHRGHDPPVPPGRRRRPQPGHQPGPDDARLADAAGADDRDERPGLHGRAQFVHQSGTPEEVADIKNSYTGEFLKEVL